MKKGAKDKRFFNLKKASSDTKLNETVNEAEVMSPPSEDTLSENVKKKKGFFKVQQEEKRKKTADGRGPYRSEGQGKEG